MTARIAAIAVAAGLATGALAWIDPLFIPLVLAGPLVSGALARGRGWPLAPVALAWAVAGISMVASDWIVNREDVAFHALLTVAMVGLAAAGWSAASLARRVSPARAR